MGTSLEKGPMFSQSRDVLLNGCDLVSGTTARYRAPGVEIDLMHAGADDLEVKTAYRISDQKEPYGLDVLPVIARHGSLTCPENGRKSLDQDLATQTALDAGHYYGLEQADHGLDRPSLRETFKIHRVAVLWSLAISASIVMEAYDASLISGFFALPAFAKRFGTQLENGKWNIDAGTQTLLRQSTKVGQLVGLSLVGYSVDRFGQRPTQLAALASLAPIIAMQVFAPNVGVLIAAQTLIGLPLSTFLTLSNVYATEITPLALHPYLTTWTQICWTLGSLLASGILRAYVNDLTELAYKVPFTLQWAWLLPIAAICIFAPESPVWCVKTDRHDRAVVAIRRLGGKGITQAQVDRRLDEIDRTNRIEAKTATHISYAELFRGSNRRRTEIACVTFAIPCLCGFVLANSTYFMQQAGLDPSASFSMTVGAAGIALVCCFGTWFILSKFGRRPVYLLGLSVLIVALLGIGGLGIPAPTSAYAWATGGLCYVFAVTYYLTVGPVTYTIITDIPATRLRPKTVVLARAAHVTTAILSNVLHNYQINKTALNWRGKAGFFWAGSSALCLTWCYFRLPETRKRSSIELDELFTNRVPARMFARTVLDGAVAHDLGSTEASTGNKTTETPARVSVTRM